LEEKKVPGIMIVPKKNSEMGWNEENCPRYVEYIDAIHIRLLGVIQKNKKQAYSEWTYEDRNRK
jgi:hypothetical protein